MRNRTALALSLVLVCGCIYEGTRVGVDRAVKSLPSLKAVTPFEAHAGIGALQGELAQVQRNVGKPKVPATPIDFSKDTANQAGTQEAVANTAKLKKQIDDWEKFWAGVKNWGLGGLAALLGLFGIKAGWIFKLLGTIKTLKAAYEQKSGEVMSLVEGTQEVIHQAKGAGGAVMKLITKMQDGYKPNIEDIRTLAGLGEETVKKIMAEYQQAHGTWQGLTPVIDEVKKYWKAGEPA